MGGLCSRRSTLDGAPVGGFPHVNGHFGHGSALVFRSHELTAKINCHSNPLPAGDNEDRQPREPFSFPETSAVSYTGPEDINDGIPCLSRAPSQKSGSTKSKQAAVAKVSSNLKIYIFLLSKISISISIFDGLAEWSIK